MKRTSDLIEWGTERFEQGLKDSSEHARRLMAAEDSGRAIEVGTEVVVPGGEHGIITKSGNLVHVEVAGQSRMYPASAIARA